MTKEGIKAYKLTELVKKEKLDYRTIKRRTSDYIPVIFENALARNKSRAWIQKNPYSVRYIRRKDLEKFIK